jgi:hypothetical protein
MPSGRFPSSRNKPGGSKTEAVLDDRSARMIRLLTSVCRECRPALRRQLRPCTPKSSTEQPHNAQTWGSQHLLPRRRDVAIRRALSFNLDQDLPLV